MSLSTDIPELLITLVNIGNEDMNIHVLKIKIKHV